MPWIKYDSSRKRELDEAERSWASRLPKKMGQIGGAMISRVDAPQIGNTGRCLIAPEFLEFLRREGFPFEDG